MLVAEVRGRVNSRAIDGMMAALLIDGAALCLRNPLMMVGTASQLSQASHASPQAAAAVCTSLLYGCAHWVYYLAIAPAITNAAHGSAISLGLLLAGRK